ncbi:prolyl-tRNA synthetase [Patescibacteria group bacterium]|nr:prolyl-tRNA synthetase [Patescibacteria group bacterium]
MKYSNLFTKTLKDIPHDADSANAEFLTRGGYIHQEVAGVYTFCPLGLKVLRKVEQIIREEMEAIGGQEILMPAMTPKEVWVKTGRWDNFDALFRFKGAGDKEYALGATHEEIVTPLGKDYTFSYKDLPFSVFQIQNKFRNEPRAKSGILRGREFSMKDLYSFHTGQEDLDKFYEIAKKAYYKIFERLGFDPKITYLTYASGGAFSKYSHEFQVVSDVGEDHIYCCEKCRVAVNREILDDQKTCPECDNKDLVEKKGIEVGNIFKLGTKFSDSFEFKYTDENGKQNSVPMGCYGIGPSRIMGSLVEVYHDENGIMWPKPVTPFQVHLISIKGAEKEADKLYDDLKKEGVEVLYDDRDERPGAKFNDADLIGIPLRIVVSTRTLEKEGVEWKERDQKEAKDVALDKLVAEIKKYYS